MQTKPLKRREKLTFIVDATPTLYYKNANIVPKKHLKKQNIKATHHPMDLT